MTHRSRTTRFTRIGLFVALFVFLTQLPAAFAQQEYVGRYDLYTGFSDLNTPALHNINQVGFHLQAGINNNRWLSTGFDYSIQTGDTTLIPSLASPAITAGLTQLYELRTTAYLPPTYAVNLPLVRDHADLHRRLAAQLSPLLQGDPLHPSQPRSLPHLRNAPSPRIPMTRSSPACSSPIPHSSTGPEPTASAAARSSPSPGTSASAPRLDAVYNHPFNYVLANGGWSYRSSIGPSFHFGRNVPAHSKASSCISLCLKGRDLVPPLPPDQRGISR